VSHEARGFLYALNEMKSSKARLYLYNLVYSVLNIAGERRGNCVGNIGQIERIGDILSR
jgi:hypothetical protein